VSAMTQSLDPHLIRDLTEAKAALARHGIVIIRSIETELEPAVMAAAKESMAAKPAMLAKMDDDELDRFVDSLRKKTMRSASELRGLHVRLLAKLGTDYIVDLVKELDGIDELFTWERIAKAATKDIDQALQDKGFAKVDMPGPDEVSENFAVELGEKWSPAFARFKSLAVQAADILREQGAVPPARTKGQKAKRKG